MMKRAYQQKKRAEAAAETRQRIVEAVVDLHKTVGPRQTSISEIARRAGVERLTVYNHFPSEADLVGACQSHWLAQHPPPDPGEWARIVEPEARLRAALAALYDWFSETEPMTANVMRDAPAMEAFDAVMAGMQAGQEQMLRLLSQGFADARKVEATLAVATAFPTWQMLARQRGLGNEEIVELALNWVRAIASI